MATTPLTAAARKRITADWQSFFPNLGVYKPMWLMKRNGPLLMGITLDRTRANDVYIPIFHVFNLISSFPEVALGLDYAVPDEKREFMRREIKVNQHATAFSPAVETIKNMVPEIAMTQVSLSTILRMYNHYIEQQRSPAIAKYPQWEFMDVVLLSFWAGHETYAIEVLNGACEIMQSWPSTELVRMSPTTGRAEFTTVSRWRTELEQLLDRTALETRLSENIKKHKASHLPVYELISDEPPQPNIVDVYKAVWGAWEA